MKDVSFSEEEINVIFRALDLYRDEYTMFGRIFGLENRVKNDLNQVTAVKFKLRGYSTT